MAGAPTGGTTAAMSTMQPAQAYQATQQPNVFNQASQGLNLAMQGTAAGMGYQPQQVAAAQYNPTMAGSTGYNPALAQSRGYDANTWQAGQLAGTNLNPYMNPYEQSVIGGLQNDAFSQYQKMNNQLGAEATAAGAFGGSRHGIAQGTMATGVQDALNKQIAGLRMGGFQNAQQMAMGDIANRMAASQANQNALNQAGQFGASAYNQMALANQGALNQAGQFGAGAANTAALQNQQAANQAGQYNAGNIMQAQQLNQQAGLTGNQQLLGASSQMGNLANLGFGMGMQTQESMAQQGALQQAMQQMMMDKAAQQWNAYQNSPYQSLNAATSALGAMPNQSTTTQTGNQKRSLFDYLAMGASVWPS